MYPETLAFGIVDRPSPHGDAALASKLRDLTISWSRYDYRGRSLVSETLAGVLDQALELGYRWCLVQETGHVILEGWHADEGQSASTSAYRTGSASTTFSPSAPSWAMTGSTTSASSSTSLATAISGARL